MVEVTLYLVVSYALGAIPFGYLLVRCLGGDIRNEGSGNIGACNVWRSRGRGAALLTLVCDCGKGALPVAYALVVARSPVLGMAGLTLAVLGHITTPLLVFRGGKGVATFLGGYLVYWPGAALAFVLAFVSLLCVRRYVSLASLGGVAAAFSVILLSAPHEVAAMACLASLVVVARHRSNIVRLLQGQEFRFEWRRNG